MKDYARKSTFAGFLPGIAGEKGIPLWCFYVNRGQGVVSFGINDKEHAIMEFYPAHVAYQNVKRTGFRTFLKKDGKVYEPFSDETLSQTMDIQMNGLHLAEKNEESGLSMEVQYYVLPGERIGALVREVTVKNIANRACQVEILDGMPALIPYGISVENLKNMTQTAKAWMMAENVDGRAELFKLRTCMDDLANVDEIEGANFSMAVDEQGNALSGIVDPEVIFAYDTSLANPVRFRAGELEEILSQKQKRANLFPCSFFAAKRELKPGEQMKLFELYGQVENKDLLQDFLKKPLREAYFEEKRVEAQALTESLTDVIDTHTGDPDFDAYCRYTFMDNVLRGGMPIRLTDQKVFYLYSRKHGDLERDYNAFSMLPEYYSQGNGNFRDVNQNRRCDTFFAPYVGRKNIHTFYGLIQLDGYNPLKIETVTYTLPEEKKQELPEKVTGSGKISRLLQKPFTPGRLYEALESEISDEKERTELFTRLLDASQENISASFGEGFWSDHWDYNLDLIEDYLAVFPEQERDLYFECAYPFYQSPVGVLPREKRLVRTQKGIRQYHFLQPVAGKEGFLEDPAKEGELLKVTLLEKMILLCALKFAALDEQGMGVEMEGGKPGWYDALNGLPGMLGSSMAETYELVRNLYAVKNVLERYPEQVTLLAELAELLERLYGACDDYLKKGDRMDFWNDRNEIRETYRAKVYSGISGQRREVSAAGILKMLSLFLRIAQEGVERAKEGNSESVPTYFYYEVREYREEADGIVPLRMEQHAVADFLEGPVRYLKLPLRMAQKRELYQRVRGSRLYDRVLGMYKVNASLRQESLELGRATAFTPGWLENESIWLHMEYKYLLELLKSGLYEEFGRDFRQMGIPFQPEERYGRSHLENSSFLASSSNPDPDIWGKGFVARLSGSTVEFLHMWRIMLFGQEPFVVKDGELVLALAPVIPEYLIGEDLCITATFLGKVRTVYHLPARRNLYPGSYRISRIALTDQRGEVKVLEDGQPQGKDAEKLRSGCYKEMEIWMEGI